MATVALPPLDLFINNEFVPSLSGKRFSVIQPATEQVICEVAEAGVEDVDRAVAAASRAQPGWHALGWVARQKLLLKLADIWDAHSTELGKLESFNNGTNIGIATAIVANLAEEIRCFASWAGKLDGRVPVPPNEDVLAYVNREPLGVCGLILPWNLPLWVMMVKLAPCLAAGNTAVIKPAESTPLTALRVAELFKLAGFPPGVVNVVNGFGAVAGSALASHPGVAKVAFTGSTAVGKTIMTLAANSNLKRVQLELGGKGPLIICPGVNLDKAVELAALAMWTNNSEICTAGSRTYVHESLYDEFVIKAAAAAKAIKVGHQLKEDTQMGPMVNKAQYEKVLKYIDLGRSEGARLVTGGQSLRSEMKGGYFIEPTVFADVKDSMRICKEEIFGPVQCILKWSSVEDVLQRANALPYGLSAGVMSDDVHMVHTITKRLKAGYVWVNTWHLICPNIEFGGSKQSGFGREGGVEGAYEWTQSKSVVMAMTSRL
jgi:aldehyde dehydrogenase (NAD+)